MNSRVIIGSVLFSLWLVMHTVIFSFIALLISPFPALFRYRVIVNWAKLVIFGLKVFCKINYQVVNESNISKQPCVYLSRHESAWEAIALLFILPPTSFVLKKSLLFIPFFGWGLWQMSPIPINRGKPHQAIKQLYAIGKNRLQSGFNVVIFPEGTRLAPTEEKKYFSGGASLAKKARVPIIPLALDSGQCWHRNSFLKHPGLITVQVGNTIPTTALSIDQINEKAKTWITETRLNFSTNKTPK